MKGNKMNVKKVVGIIVAAFVAIGLLAACDSTPTAQSAGQDQTEQSFKQQSAAVPYPVDELKDSLERRNLKERLLRTNNPNLQGYVYLMSFGKFVGYYTVKGKISSVQSQMTTDNLVVDKSHGAVTVNAPGDDGSYGQNEGGDKGIFFFTTEGAFVETTLDFLWSDKIQN